LHIFFSRQTGYRDCCHIEVLTTAYERLSMLRRSARMLAAYMLVSVTTAPWALADLSGIGFAVMRLGRREAAAG
jgi:hypothetical protein